MYVFIGVYLWHGVVTHCPSGCGRCERTALPVCRTLYVLLERTAASLWGKILKHRTCFGDFTEEFCSNLSEFGTFSQKVQLCLRPVLLALLAQSFLFW